MKWRSLEDSTPGTDTRSLQDIFAERKALVAKYVPPDIQGVHARVIAELKEKHLAGNILSAGAKAPVFELNNHSGTPLSSTELLARGRLVICFFRGRCTSRPGACWIWCYISACLCLPSEFGGSLAGNERR